MFFLHRREAGRALAEAAKTVINNADQDLLVLGIPRGGVVVADEVAQGLGASLDIIIAKKLPPPHNEELAIGAVAPDGTTLLNENLIRYLNVQPEYLQTTIEKARLEIGDRLERYRGSRSLPDAYNKSILVVDDGVATGYTVIAALRYLRKLGPKRLIMATPVAPTEAVEDLKKEADEVVCLSTPEPFYAVGQFYHNFAQVSDDEVKQILNKYKKS